MNDLLFNLNKYNFQNNMIIKFSKKNKRSNRIALIDENIDLTNNNLKESFSKMIGINNQLSIHGTMMAGAISIFSNKNDILHIYNVRDNQGIITISKVFRSFKQAIKDGSNIIVFPVSSILPISKKETLDWIEMFNSISKLIYKSNVIIIDSAGNEGLNLNLLNDKYIAVPQMIPRFITIGGMTANYRTDYTNYGSNINYYFFGGDRNNYFITTLGSLVHNVNPMYTIGLPKNLIRIYGTSISAGLFAGYISRFGIEALINFRNIQEW